jgi:DNA-binding CsgD family transcriptional regulator
VTTPGRLGDALTAGELQALVLTADGLSNADIGRRLDASMTAVRSRLMRANQKLGAVDRANAVAIGFRTGLIPGAPAPLPPAVPIPHERASVSLPARSPLPAPPSVLEEALAAAEAVVAGRPHRLVHQLAMRALTAAGRRGPGGRFSGVARGRVSS